MRFLGGQMYHSQQIALSRSIFVTYLTFLSLNYIHLTNEQVKKFM